MTITPQEIDALRHEFITQAINYRLISDPIARASGNVDYCRKCFNIALENIGRRNLSHINMPNIPERDGVRIASTFIQGYLTAKSIDEIEQPTDRFAMGTPDVAHAGKQSEVKLSTGQTWTHKQKGYDVKINSINRTGALAVEEVATGQRDGFCRAAFLDTFAPKNKEGEL